MFSRKVSHFNDLRKLKPNNCSSSSGKFAATFAAFVVCRKDLPPEIADLQKKKIFAQKQILSFLLFFKVSLRFSSRLASALRRIFLHLIPSRKKNLSDLVSLFHERCRSCWCWRWCWCWCWCRRWRWQWRVCVGGGVDNKAQSARV